MRFLLLVPGTGRFYCGSCLRDDALGRALRRLGHEVVVAPLYLPRVLESDTVDERVHLGGINLYLQQKWPLLGRLPRPLARALDSPRLLRWAARRASLTRAGDLGAMTLSLLAGEHGRQRAELDRLVAWAAAGPRPDVVVLSNALLVGTARRLEQALGCVVVTTLQGEAAFVDALPPPLSERAWQALRQRAADVDLFVAVSRWYGDVMRARLALGAERLAVVHNGIELQDMTEEPAPLARRRPQTVGYLARMCRDKGLHTLVEAFVLLARTERWRGLQLRVAGAVLADDRAFVRGLQERLRAGGCEQDAVFAPNLTLGDKLALLRSLSVFSVPATYGESFGLYVLEALAAGVPVVQPRHGAFPELLAATGGGVLCPPNDPAALAAALEELLLDEPHAQQLALAGRRAVFEHFGADRMAREFASVCQAVLEKAPRPEQVNG